MRKHRIEPSYLSSRRLRSSSQNVKNNSRRWPSRPSYDCMANYYCTADDERRTRIACKGVSAFRQFATGRSTRRSRTRSSSYDLRLLKTGKLSKSFQYLAVGLGQPDRSLFQVGWMPAPRPE